MVRNLLIILGTAFIIGLILGKVNNNQTNYNMETVRPIKTDEYYVKYWIFEFHCPKCGAENELHLEEDALFVDKKVDCYKCKHEYKVKYN